MKKTDSNDPKKRRPSLTGLIIPSAWDSEGNTTGVLLAAFNDEEYLLEAGPLAKKLIGLIHKKVEITGPVRKLRNGSHVVSVSSFKVLEDPMKDSAYTF